ncbi:hypothetical protein [Kutzneria kofuensis]|uniref:hypothetical protein n=1 Tax=Kutzneria kofuensis TaxID=103725 RepID=UPI0031ED46DF
MVFAAVPSVLASSCITRPPTAVESDGKLIAFGRPRAGDARATAAGAHAPAVRGERRVG